MVNYFDILAVSPPSRFTHFSANAPSGQASPMFTVIHRDWLYTHRAFGVNQMAPETSSPRQLEDTDTHKQDMGRPTVVPSLRWRNWNRPTRAFSRALLQEAVGQKVFQIICGCLQTKMSARNNITAASYQLWARGNSDSKNTQWGKRISYIKCLCWNKGCRFPQKTVVTVANWSESKKSRKPSRFPPTQPTFIFEILPFSVQV